MKKMYESPKMEVMVLSADLMTDNQSLYSGSKQEPEFPFAPKPRPDKPF